MGVALKSIFVVVLLGMAIMPVFGQDKDFIPAEGEVVEGEFLINKQLEITLPTAQRIFQKVPPDEIDSKQTDPLEYTFKNYTPPLTDIRTRLRVLKLKDENAIVSAPGSYLKLGFGNYYTPFVEAALNSGPNKTGNYGLKVHHLSSKNGPVDKENSGDSHSSIGLFGNYIGGNASVGGDLEYELDKYHFYGYDPGADVSKDSIKQTFNAISLGFDIKSTKPESAIQYDIYGKVHNIADYYNASELAFKTGLDGNYAISDNMDARLGLDLLFASYKNPEKINRTLVRVTPAFVYANNGLTLDIGMNIVYHDDTLNNKNKTQIFPALRLAYEINDNISAYGVLEGDVEEVTYKQIINENPYITDNIPITNTNKNLDIKVGLNGSLIQYLAFDVGVRSALYKNMYFYLNDPLAANRFNVVYDEGNTSLFQGYASLSYFKNNTIGSTLSAKFNAYNTGDISKAWHRPKIEFDYSIWYNFYSKVKFTADLFMFSGIQAMDFDAPEPASIKLDPAIDLNLKVDYIISERYSAFVSVSNVFDNKYQLYYRYPTRGLLAMIGFSISF